jgi:predicted anti-sigma-YlaC factor YlaD
MPKQPLSVTLDEANLLWLRGRVASTKRRSLSEALDAVITAARTGGHGADAVRSVTGTIDIAADDPHLARADSYIAALVDDSLSRPVLARETGPAVPPVRVHRGSTPKKAAREMKHRG